VLGQPIEAAMTSMKKEAVLFLGRQHPPEVSGAMTMKRFVDTVFSDTPLANRFRERFTVIVIPLINPDGVVAGHWRHNMNGVDLNRDWGPFSQPETQSIALLLADMEQDGIEPKLMLDFHSTRESLFYTQRPGDINDPVDFATAWLTASREQLPGFEFKHDPRPPSGQANSKNYFFGRYGIPAITYEIGDEVDRETIRSSTPVFAEEMMELMLAE
jgi:predicted deacylase